MTPFPLYNPALLPPERFALATSLRRPLAQRLLAILRRIGARGAPQHQLVLGAPGSGKTMLLRVLQSEILRDPDLAQRWLPITFPEAQWDVSRPADFWDNALAYLVVALSREGAEDEAQRLEAQREALPPGDEARAQAALALLTTTSRRLGRRFVLLVDTLDVVLDRMKRDQWHMREVLSEEPRLLLIGASARAIEATYRYDAAFYDFFQLHELRPLARKALPELLGDVHPDDPLAHTLRLARRAPALFEALLDLLGTQPRVLAMLGHQLQLSAMLDASAGATAEPAPELVTFALDALTPTMTARVEALAPQSQVVALALAACWHPARPNELAERTHLAANVVSAQLHRLVQDGVVEKVPLPRGWGRQGFQLTDRLLQVWLLMRMGQPHRRRLLRAAHLLAETHAGNAHHGRVEILPQPPDPDPADYLLRIAPELRALVAPESPAAK